MYALDGTYDGEDARIEVDDGKVDGYPTGAVNDARLALITLAVSKQQVPVTPTGPFLPFDSSQAQYLTVLSCLDLAPAVTGDVPDFEDYGWELPDVEGQDSDPSDDVVAAFDGKTTRQVHVKPYVREGRPVGGYLRNQLAAFENDGWKIDRTDLPDPVIKYNIPDMGEPVIDPHDLVDAFDGLKRGNLRIAVTEVKGWGGGSLRLAGYVQSPEFAEAAKDNPQMVQHMLQFAAFGVAVYKDRVELESLFIPPGYQSAGFGSAVLRYVEDFTRAIGKDKITLTAAHTGAYAWARAGFDFEWDVKVNGARALLDSDDGTFESMLEGPDYRYTDRGMEIPASVTNEMIEKFLATFPSDDDFEKAEDNLERAYPDTFSDDLPPGEYARIYDETVPPDKFRHPIEIANYGRDEVTWNDKDYGEMWLGKAFMIGKKWEGVKPVPPETKSIDPGTLSQLYDDWCRASELAGAAAFPIVHMDEPDDAPGFFRDDNEFWRVYAILGSRS